MKVTVISESEYKQLKEGFFNKKEDPFDINTFFKNMFGEMVMKKERDGIVWYGNGYLNQTSSRVVVFPLEPEKDVHINTNVVEGIALSLGVDLLKARDMFMNWFVKYNVNKREMFEIYKKIFPGDSLHGDNPIRTKVAFNVLYNVRFSKFIGGLVYGRKKKFNKDDAPPLSTERF
jgi:hypothetical protein